MASTAWPVRPNAMRWSARRLPRETRRAEPGSAMLVRVQRPSDIPLESLHGRKDDVGRTLRLTVRAVRRRRDRSASSR